MLAADRTRKFESAHGSFIRCYRANDATFHPVPQPVCLLRRLMALIKSGCDQMTWRSAGFQPAWGTGLRMRAITEQLVLRCFRWSQLVWRGQSAKKMDATTALTRRSLIFPFNPHPACGHPLPLPRAKELALSPRRGRILRGTRARRRPCSEGSFPARNRPEPRETR